MKLSLLRRKESSIDFEYTEKYGPPVSDLAVIYPGGGQKRRVVSLLICLLVDCSFVLDPGGFCLGVHLCSGHNCCTKTGLNVVDQGDFC